MATLALKHYLTTLQEVQPLTPSQTILARIYTLIRLKGVNRTKSGPHPVSLRQQTNSLKEIVDAILRELNQGYLKVPKGVPKTTATQTFGYAARQLISNFEVHVDQHAPGFLECWMGNHIRAIIHPLDRANTDAILPASLTAMLNEDQIERLNALKSATRRKKEHY